MKPVMPNIPTVLAPAKEAAALQDAQLRLEALLRTSNEGVVNIAADGTIVTFNRAAEKLFGYTPSEIIGQNVSMLMPEPYRSEHDNYLRRYLETGQKHVLDAAREIIALRKDGTSFPAELAIAEVNIQSGKQFIGIVRDISEHKKAKTSYLQKTSELQAIFESLPDCYFRLGADATILDYHVGKRSRFGSTTERYFGQKIVTLVPKDIAPKLANAVAHVSQTNQTVSFDYAVDAHGQRVAFQLEVKPFLRQQLLLVVRDVTAEQQAKDAQTRYHALDEILPIGIFRADASGHLTFVNEQWTEIANLTSEAAQGKGWFTAVHPEDRNRIFELWRKCVEEAAPFKAEFRFKHSERVIAWAYCQAVPERDPAGQVTGFIGTITDITDRIKADEALRKAHIELEMRVEERTADLRATNRWLQQMITERRRAEKALREERNFISTVLETAGALVVVCESNGVIVQFNRSCHLTTGFAADEMKGKVVWDLFGPPTTIDEIKDIFHRLIAGEDRIEHEGHWRTQKGQTKLIAWANTAIRDADNNVRFIVCTGIDISEQRLAEEEARQHQNDLVHVSRLSTMGEMAAGLAHELNQPLAAIVSYTQGCVRRIANGSPPNDVLEAMKQVTIQAQRAGEIIKHLRSFVSKGEPQRSTTHANEMVREILNMAKIDIRKYGATIRLRLSETLPTVHADLIQIEQVILNLVRNGLEAMAANDPAQREMAIRTFINSNGMVQVSVTDSGEGFAADFDPEQVFQAFFTTKKEGMGMGLAISRTIIEAHGGRLWAERNPDRGATFHFTLPV